VPRISFLAVACLVSVSLASCSTRPDAGGSGDAAPACDPATLRERAWAALGSSKTIDAIAALTFKGRRESLLVGGTLSGKYQPSEIAITIRPPEYYLRAETRQLDGGAVTWLSGFSGDRLLNDVRTTGAGVQFGGSWGPDQLRTERAHAARLLLGILALDTPALPVRFGAEEVPPSADYAPCALVVSGGEDFDVRLQFSANSVPRTLSYWDTVHLPGTPDADASSIGAPPAAKRLLVTLEFSDHRHVRGVLVPHRITRSAGGFVLEDAVFSDVTAAFRESGGPP
jgi:hypothetical protein